MERFSSADMLLQQIHLFLHTVNNMQIFFLKPYVAIIIQIIDQYFPRFQSSFCTYLSISSGENVANNFKCKYKEEL